MTITINHKFRSQKPDGTDASVMRPSNWNEAHNITMAAGRLMGRITAGEGQVEEITLGAGLSFANGALVASASTDAVTLGGQAPSYYTAITARLGYTPPKSPYGSRIAVDYQGGDPIITVDVTNFVLATKPYVDNVNNQANNAITIANNAFNNMRLVSVVSHPQASFQYIGDGRIITGYTREAGATGQVQVLYSMQLQGYSPSRGWVPCLNQ